MTFNPFIYLWDDLELPPENFNGNGHPRRPIRLIHQRRYGLNAPCPPLYILGQRASLARRESKSN
jgi:hypothetical protein